MLREQDHVTTRELGLTVGFRFGARLLELRRLKFVIDERAIGGSVSGSRYTLTAEPDTSTSSPASLSPAGETPASISTPSARAQSWPGPPESRRSPGTCASAAKGSSKGTAALNGQTRLFDLEAAA